MSPLLVVLLVMADGALGLHRPEILKQVYEIGCEAEPSIHIEPAVWESVGRIWLRLTRERAEVICHARIPEVFIAVAAVAGDASAWEVLMTHYVPKVRAALRSAGVAPHAQDDVLAQLRTRLFVATPDRPAKVLRYVGSGDLAGLLKVTALRLAFNAARGTRTVAADEALLDVPDGVDIELQSLQRRYRVEFKRAFEEAVGALDPEDRNLLRLNIVDGLSIDRIAVVFGIHRATAARRIARARARVGEHVRHSLQAQLDQHAALPSILRLIRSDLDLSLSRILAS